MPFQILRFFLNSRATQRKAAINSRIEFPYSGTAVVEVTDVVAVEVARTMEVTVIVMSEGETEGNDFTVGIKLSRLNRGREYLSFNPFNA